MFIFIYWYFFIRSIRIISVRFTTEFFSNAVLSYWHRCFARWGTVFQTAVTICHGNPETSSRVTLASLGIGFQPNLMVVGHLWIKHQYKKTEKNIFVYFYLLIFFHPFNPYNQCSFHHWVFFERGFIVLTQMLRSVRYCLPDSSHYMSWKSRDFVPGYSRFARYWLPAKSYGCWSSLNKTSI